MATIRLTRPDKRNAIDLRLADELIDALDRFVADDTAGVAVLSGEGEGFSSGGDITMFPDLDAHSGLEFVRGRGQRIHQTIARSRKPVIAAVHGFCLAGGFEIALACHMIFASEDARFAMREVRLGLLPGWGGSVRLARAVAPGLAADLLLTGRSIDAHEAFTAGLVSRVLPDRDACLEAALDAGREIASHPSMAAEGILDVIRAANSLGDEVFALEQTWVSILFGSPHTQRRVADTLNTGVSTTSDAPTTEET